MALRRRFATLERRSDPIACADAEGGSAMDLHLRRYLKSTWLQMLAWMGAGLLFVLIRYVGLEDSLFLDVDSSRRDWGVLLPQSLAAGAVAGLAYGLLDVVLDRPRLRRLPYGRLILLQTVFHLLLLSLVLAGVFANEVRIYVGGWDTGRWLALLCSANSVMILIYTTLVSFWINFLKQVDRKFGPGNLRRLMLGTYHQPREEQRIFMFLDLKGSTGHAERLGHVCFSRLIQDCFQDLSVVMVDAAQVYQYVGDEVILCWDVAGGTHDGHCLRAFFRFRRQLQRREAYYRRTYGLMPEFKAGMNLGLATVAEVGEIKREISFLGDVLNTAARIEAMCNEFGEALLISRAVYDAVGTLPGFAIRRVGCVELRGRSDSVEIYAVNEAAA